MANTRIIHKKEGIKDRLGKQGDQRDDLEKKRGNKWEMKGGGETNIGVEFLFKLPSFNCLINR